MNQTILNSIRNFYGATPRVSDWITVDQTAIDQFGESTRDQDWLHTDPERARRESPFGGAIAMGFWSVSLLTYFSRQTLGSDYPEGVRFALNYGLDKVRWTAPIPVGARIRNHMELMGVEERGDDRVLVTTSNRIEIDGVEKPAMIAQWRMLMFCDC